MFTADNGSALETAKNPNILNAITTTLIPTDNTMAAFVDLVDNNGEGLARPIQHNVYRFCLYWYHDKTSAAPPG